ncbi:hypothetical protein [Halomarina pelagica]|uniref:hypothetical protein n=1 Tax=Halomarina pelagica TaxID=2961599 RepID=UPI0020C305BA|nr:hypothetical protein [Halomarina sp. BND7]
MTATVRTPPDFLRYVLLGLGPGLVWFIFALLLDFNLTTAVAVGVISGLTFILVTRSITVG